MEIKDTQSRGEVMRSHIEACKAVDKTVIAYCKEHGLTPSNYYYWQKKLNATTAKPLFTQLSAMPVQAVMPTVCYPNRVRIEFNNIVRLF